MNLHCFWWFSGHALPCSVLLQAVRSTVVRRAELLVHGMTTEPTFPTLLNTAVAFVFIGKALCGHDASSPEEGKETSTLLRVRGMDNPRLVHS